MEEREEKEEEIQMIGRGDGLGKREKEDKVIMTVEGDNFLGWAGEVNVGEKQGDEKQRRRHKRRRMKR